MRFRVTCPRSVTSEGKPYWRIVEASSEKQARAMVAKWPCNEDHTIEPVTK